MTKSNTSSRRLSSRRLAAPVLLAALILGGAVGMPPSAAQAAPARGPHVERPGTHFGEWPW